jgi:Xaa-Pro aminopeptidase
MDKAAEKPKTTLFIEEADPTQERWYGKKVTMEEAKKISGIEDVRFLESFEGAVDYAMTREDVESLYFDCYRHQMADMQDYNVVMAEEFRKKYPGVGIKNLFPMVAAMRMQKDEDEIALIREAVAITDKALQNVMSRLKPGMKEYQAQADFEYVVKYSGADGMAFPTIAGSGKNGTMLHYETNRETCEEGTLLLLDLGAKYEGYCADITRTYPVNGRYTERQRAVYDIVLAANRKVAETAKAGMTLKELNEVCKKVLAEGCIRLGLIKEE